MKNKRQNLVTRFGWRVVCVVVLVLVGATLFCGEVGAQGTKADYERAASLRKQTENKIFNRRIEPKWTKDGNAFWYRRQTGGATFEYVWVDAVKGEKRPAFDHEKLAGGLSQQIKKEIKPGELLLEQLEWAVDGKRMMFSTEGKKWSCDLTSYALKDEGGDGEGLEPDLEARASRRTGGETRLIFENKTMGAVELFWIDSDGKKQAYGRIGAGERRVQNTYAGHVWSVEPRDGGQEIARYTARELTSVVVVGEERKAEAGQQRRGNRRRSAPREAEPKEEQRGQSPDGKWIVYVRDFNLFLRNRESGKEAQLSFDGGLGEGYREEVSWAPDSKHLVGTRVTAGAERKVYMVESSPADQLQPKLQSYEYYKPGDKLPHPHLVVFDVLGGQPRKISEELFSNPFTETGDVDLRWEKDSSSFTFVYNQRGHQVLRVLRVDAVSGVVKTLVDEQAKTFISYSGKQYLNFLEDGKELIWMSERNGWNHLYLYDAEKGEVKNAITQGEWVVIGVDRVDEKKRQLWFRAAGMKAGEDPYHVHRCRVNLDGTGFVKLTEGDGNHLVQWSPDRRFFVDTYSRVDLGPVHELRKGEDGGLVLEVEKVDTKMLEATGWKAPERFVAKGRDGQTDIYGLIYRPTNFDPTRKYPVIEYIYAGPHDSHVPKDFNPMPGGSVREMAELGFIVVQIDGMGTSNRSKKFHDVCWQNIGDAGFPDRILWMKSAAAKYPYMDVSRVGIYGGSAGGQNSTRALLAFGDFYKVAVSDCGCHDNRMDKIWWNEQWMGWPVGKHYEDQSNVTQAHRLQGKLMLVVGELDRNVDPASTMQVANALIKADKDFDLLVVPGGGHGSAESPYGKRRRADFFVRHLLGVEPRSGD